MTTPSEELEARERTTTVPGSTPAKKPTKETHTAATLFTSTNKITCSYCRQDHLSNSCGVVAQPQARREVLQRSGRCFVCLSTSDKEGLSCTPALMESQNGVHAVISPSNYFRVSLGSFTLGPAVEKP